MKLNNVSVLWLRDHPAVIIQVNTLENFGRAYSRTVCMKISILNLKDLTEEYGTIDEDGKVNLEP